MTEEGVTGTFFVIGEKARMMEKRGRRDVIEAMSEHDIGSHTNYGSIHRPKRFHDVADSMVVT